ADVVYGSSVANTVTGAGGDDTFFAAAGTSSDGADTFFGGAGTDRFAYDDVTVDVAIDLAAGTATVDGEGAIDTFTSVEAASGGTGDDVIVGDGVANTLSGNSGAD